MIATDDFLTHYGVKGMRWGVRKPEERAATGAPGRVPTKRTSAPNSDIRPKKKKRKLTDTELREKVNRTRMKKDLSSLKGESKTNSHSLREKTVSSLTDAQLKRRIDRVRMEKELSSLESEAAAPSLRLGQKIATNIASNAAQNIGTKLITGGANYAINRTIARLINEDMAEAVYPVGKKKKKNE